MGTAPGRTVNRETIVSGRTTAAARTRFRGSVHLKKSRTMFRASPAFAFVLTMGVVNLSGDLTYEGGGSINGQFMATLGATAAVVSITAGLGEFLGYALRSVSGYIADKSGMYWAITFIGYAIHTFEGDRGEHAAERET